MTGPQLAAISRKIAVLLWQERFNLKTEDDINDLVHRTLSDFAAEQGL